jgi:predicted HTH domain antitoxin
MEEYKLVPANDLSAKPLTYRKNLFRQCLIGKYFVDDNNPDMFTFSNETDTDIDLEVLHVFEDFSSNGYYQLEYTDKSGKTQKDFVHRVVCFTWNEKYDSFKDEVHHKDRNKKNNRADNLIPVPPFFNSAAELKANNPKAKEYLSSVINSEAFNYESLVISSRMVLEEESYFTFNELSELDKKTFNAMKYLLEKNGYKVEKDDDDDKDSSPVKV